MKILLKCLSSVAGLAAVALFALPTSSAFTTLGGSLALSADNYQRDFRVYNNTLDFASNDDQTPDPNYPGALGAVKAVWKGGETWNSDKEGGAGFDAEFQGEHTSAGGVNDNVISWSVNDPVCSGGTVAYINPGGGSGISNGWTIKLCSQYLWNDGTGIQGYDIQGVVARMYGHALGLGNSSSGCSSGCGSNSYSTMCQTICGNSHYARTLSVDDKAGVAFIYGTTPSNKPVINGISGSMLPGGALTIHGSNFANTVNVKFTVGTSQDSGAIPGTVFNAVSTNGGTQVTVTVPSNAQDGLVTIWQPANNRMSNPFPLDLSNGSPPPTINSVTPVQTSTVGGEQITLSGTGFTGVTQVQVGGATLSAPLDFVVANDNTITFGAPFSNSLGSVNVNVAAPSGASNSGTLTYVLTDPLELKGPGFINNGGTAEYRWGGKANQTTFFSVSGTGSIGTHQGTNLLLPIILISLPNTNAAGVGELAAPINGATAGLQIFTQIWTLSGLSESTLEASNIHKATVLF